MGSTCRPKKNRERRFGITAQRLAATSLTLFDLITARLCETVQLLGERKSLSQHEPRISILSHLTDPSEIIRVSTSAFK